LQSSECLEVCEDIGYTQTSAQKHKVSQGFWLYSPINQVCIRFVLWDQQRYN
ncbi:unnamed protein product, partial [Musa hybrid cultivar]